MLTDCSIIVVAVAAAIVNIYHYYCCYYPHPPYTTYIQLFTSTMVRKLKVYRVNLDGSW